uniref:Uncharacterized protein n=1 Tax=Arundo donax TaxID=35708 RepID=A0A0A9CQG9_ARUDO
MLNSSANASMSDVISEHPFRPTKCEGSVPHLSSSIALPIWLCKSSKSSAATACLFMPISRSTLIFGGLSTRPILRDDVKVAESSLTFALKLYFELGTLENKISTKFWPNPRL